jgi:asparagine synthetase B (glutamine-hydrolysing)
MALVEIHRDTAFGLRPYYFHEDGDIHAPTVREVHASLPGQTLRPDVNGLRQYLERKAAGRSTCFAEIAQVPQDHCLQRNGRGFSLSPVVVARRPEVDPDARNKALASALELALDKAMSVSRRPALALSGGLDSALLLALCRRRHPDLAVVTLATSFPGYCELETTLATARALGFPDVQVIKANADDFLSALPGAIAAAERPLYNLHPVSKWLLARELRRGGFDLLITGDGADQVFAGSDPRDYLPIVGASVRAAALALACPFLDPDVRAFQLEGASDPGKLVLRALAAELLPPTIAERPKQPRLAPEFGLSCYRSAGIDEFLSELLQQAAPSSQPGPSNTLWATASLLYQQYGVIS